MKIGLAIILLILSELLYGQSCNCENRPELNEIISCEKTVFKNGAKIYREFNCDSSWVTFQRKNNKKIILFSLDKELIDYTGRLGFAEWFEHKNSFLVEYHTISGCCDPYQYILYDKKSGKKIENIGSQIFYSETMKYPLFVSIDEENYNFISFLNLDTNKIFKINLPKDRIKETLRITTEVFAESLFEEGEIKNGVFEISYRYKLTEKDDWKTEKIILDLKNTSANKGFVQ